MGNRYRPARCHASPHSAVPAVKTTLDMRPPDQADSSGASQHVNMDELKRQAAARALEHVQDGMKLGLGTGSTAKHFVDLLGEKVARRMKVVGVPTSEATRAQADPCGIPLTTLDEVDRLDLTVDGADEIDAALNLIKGGRRAAARKDRAGLRSHDRDRDTKWVDATRPLPLLAGRGDSVSAWPRPGGPWPGHLRKAAFPGKWGSARARTATFLSPMAATGLSMPISGASPMRRVWRPLSLIPGVVEHGLFIGLASTAVLAGAQGIRVVERR